MSLSSGQMLAHYRLAGKIGEGGMGVVHRATDTKLGREVALKVLHEAPLSDQNRRSRLDREARLLASLTHPHIATLYSFEEVGPVRFLVLELVDGETLACRLARGALPVRDALEIAHQIADALEAAHERGIIHRDLKPSNVMVTPKGIVKVLDFGLATAFKPLETAQDFSGAPTDSIALTAPGIVPGTAPYMSPEQVRGQRLDSRTDIWSFGCILYEALTRTRAFQRDTLADTFAAILSGEPGWYALPEEVPARVQVLLRRCLQKDERRRLHHIADARIELEDVLRGAPMDTPVSSGLAADTGVRSKRRTIQARWTWLGLGILGLVSVLIVLLARPGREAADLRRSWLENVHKVTSLPGDETQPALSPDGQFVAFVSEASGNKDVWVKSISGGEAVRVTVDPADDYDPDWSPDGKTIVFRSDRKNSGLYTAAPFGGDAARILDFGYLPRWSPDGGKIVFQLRKGFLIPNEIYLLEYPPRQPPRKLLSYTRGGDPYSMADWSPDGSHIVFVTGAYQSGRGLGILSLEPRGEPSSLQWDGEKITGRNPVWAGGGLGIIFSSAGSLRSLPLDRDLRPANAPRQLTTGQDDFPDVSRDGRRVAYNNSSSQSDIWKIPMDPETGLVAGQPIRLMRHPANEWAPAPLPDGRHFLFLSDRENGRHLYIADLEGGSVRLVDKSRSWQSQVGVSPDGRWIKIASGVPVLEYYLIPFDPATRQALGPARKLTGRASSNWSPDGELLSVWDGAAFVLLQGPFEENPKRSAWTLRPEFAEQYLYGTFAGFSPDGRWVAFGAYRERHKADIFILRRGSDDPRLLWSGSGFPAWMSDRERVHIWSERSDETNETLGFVRIDPDTGAVLSDFTPIGLPAELGAPGAYQCSMTGDRRWMLCAITEVEGDVYVADVWQG